MNWTKRDIDKLRVHDKTPSRKSVSKVRQTKLSKEKIHIQNTLLIFKQESIIDDFVEELKFHPKRRFRFDWAILSQMIAVEYEGIFSPKSRHTNITGYTNDCIKYNLATSSGWKILRYTAKNFKNIEEDLRLILSKNKN